MKRFLFKRCLPLLLIFLSVFLVLLVSANIFLAFKKAAFEERFSQALAQNVSIGRIYLLPPATVLIKKVTISGEDAATYANLRALKLAFSLRELLFKRKLYLPRVSLDGLDIDFIQAKERVKKISEALASSSEGRPFTVSVKNSGLRFRNEEGGGWRIYFDSFFAIDPQTGIYSDGSFGFASRLDTDLAQITDTSEPIEYVCNGYLTAEGVTLEELELSRGDFRLKLWGEIQKNTLRLKGMTFAQGVSGAEQKRDGAFFMGKLKRLFMQEGKPAPTVIGASTGSLNIFDIDTALTFGAEQIEINKLSFSLNNIPLLLTGTVTLSEPVHVDLQFSSFADKPAPLRVQKDGVFDAVLRGELSRGLFSGALFVSISHMQDDAVMPLMVRADFSNFSYGITDEGAFSVPCEEATLTLVTEQAAYTLPLRTFRAQIDPGEKEKKTVSVASKLHEGTLSATGTMAFERFPPESLFDITIQGVNANKLESLLEYFSKVHGRLNADIRYQSRPQPSLNGRIEIARGNLKDFEFFNWLAAFFRFKGMDVVQFKTVSTEFSVTPHASSLSNIILDSPEVQLSGFFTLGSDARVEGRISMELSEEVLKTSPKFRYILSHLRDDVERIGFDFQLSGLFESMHFKWLKSDFKKGLEDLLPARYETAIEKSIEEAIEAIADEQAGVEEQDFSR